MRPYKLTVVPARHWLWFPNQLLVLFRMDECPSKRKAACNAVANVPANEKWLATTAEDVKTKGKLTAEARQTSKHMKSGLRMPILYANRLLFDENMGTVNEQKVGRRPTEDCMVLSFKVCKYSIYSILFFHSFFIFSFQFLN